MILVSACLAGLNCKYTGGNNYDENKLIDRNGVLAQMLMDNNIEVISSDEYVE